jgi:hypothetical protein
MAQESQKVRDIVEKNKNIEHISSVPVIPDEYKDGKNRKDFCQWILYKTGLPSLLLDVTVPYEEMLKEAKAQDHLFVKHRGSANPEWSSMALHGQGIQYTAPAEAYIREGVFTKENSPPYAWTDLADVCPVSKEWVSSLEFDEFKRVRFMKLEPGGYIEPHRDIDTSGIHAWNVSINNPEGHIFVIDNFGYIPWEPGQLRGIDIGRYHSVVNRGSEDRIHMIIHGKFGSKFVETICRSYEKMYNEFYN